METIADDEVCQSCGQTFAWHQANFPRHPFNSSQDGATDFLKRRGARDPRQRSETSQRGAEGPQIASMTTDPVLRIALINRGILTPADLIAAEEQLKSALAEIQGGQGGNREIQERTAT